MSDRTPRHHTGITAGHFPTPHLALRGTADETQVRGFAEEQARAARSQARAARSIVPQLAGMEVLGATNRIALLTAVYDAVVRWRHALAATTADARYTAGGSPSASRYQVTLDEAGPNYDRLGEVGRLRAGARWDEATGRWVGGTDTPASLVTAAYGRAALARFAVEAPRHDRLHNRVTLPVSGGTVRGNMLVRGALAVMVARGLAGRLAARRGVTRVETTGDLLYAVTADSAERKAMFGEAMRVLASAGSGDVAAWWNAAYLLYQAPWFKKGSDAVNRVFLVAVGTVLLGEPPVLPHDLDLQCMVLGQTTVTAVPFVCGGAA
ncbi:hypothetical protein FHS29_005028 [Saccharothrix tamanrassetensis]|uniref:Uncharacterized protein n=1 Tax=Saccharothrix tamanrassetensis TaxID=1051531 RepID=A0A841CMR9_9PSEU|nr:hypothetical protein [Saccharothrix tamanrassetensis]MBB5958420.1 hypothetical protein [Saccharothrix tamanrassetensis]